MPFQASKALTHTFKLLGLDHIELQIYTSTLVKLQSSADSKSLNNSSRLSFCFNLPAMLAILRWMSKIE